MSLAERAGLDNWVPADTFASRLRTLREDLRLGQKEIAELCGVAASTWATWELGRKPHDMATVADKIHKATGVSRDWLMWGSRPLSRWNTQSPGLSTVPVVGQMELPFTVDRFLSLV